MLFHLIVAWCFFPNLVNADETNYVVNTKRPLHVVSDKFLSLSIDPAILLTKINLSDIPLQMVRRLSPSYVRLAGPSTGFVRYLDKEDDKSESKDVDTLTVTPPVWFAINEWFSMANLTPVFGINDAETVMGVWNPKSILPLLEISDKFNLTCLWQLGYDSSNKSDVQYAEDLKIMRNILDAFPDKKDSWKVVGSDVRRSKSNLIAWRILEEVRGVADFVMWERNENELEKNNVKEELIRPFVSFETGRPKIWTSLSRDHHPATFDTALAWAVDVGDAAKQGFDVIFRQPRMHEFFVDTPVFWFTLLYKTLVGNTVLDIKSTGVESKLQASAYCAKNQNNFIQSGAMVVMMINQGDKEEMAYVKIGSTAKSLEVQSYILSTKNDPRSIYLNEEKLEADILTEEKINFIPKFRRAKPLNGVSFSVPPKSIAFHVLPGAKVSTCIERENEITLLMEEIKEDQELSFSDDIPVELESRLSQKNSVTLQDIQKNLQEELEEDEQFYYSGRKGRITQKLDNVLENLHDEYHNSQINFKIDDETRKTILERARLAEAQKKVSESEQRLLDLGKLILHKSESENKGKSLIGNNSPPHIQMWKQPNVFQHKDSIGQKLNNLLENMENKPKFSRLTQTKFNDLKDQVTQMHLDHNRLTSAHQKNLHEQMLKALEKSRSNLLRKPISKTSDKSKEVGLELSSGEVKKVLADRVKSRALKTRIRFTNDEISELMKRATERLKHDHILHQRRKRHIFEPATPRVSRDINMNLLNEASKRQEMRKEKEALDVSNMSEETFTVFSRKAARPKSKFHETETILVKPKSSSSIKASKHNSDLIESDHDLDFYFDDNDSLEGNMVHDYPVYEKIDKKLKELTPKFRSDAKYGSHMKSSSQDSKSKNDLSRKFMRLDEYFRNAKKIQEDFDDIDFDESDYDDMDSKPIRMKRESKNPKPSDKECSCNKGSCCSDIKDLSKVFEKLLKGEKGDGDKFFEKYVHQYKKLAESLNDHERHTGKNEMKWKKSAKSKRSTGDVIYPSYRPLSEYKKKWQPQDILALESSILRPSKFHIARIINDFPFYEHLLHGNDVKRSIKNNEIQDDPEEDAINKIDKDFEDFKLVLPNNNTIELTKNDTYTKFLYQNDTEPVVITTTVKIEEPFHPMKVDSLGSNIQFIPKESANSSVQNFFHQVSSFFRELGSKVYNYLHQFVH